MAMPLPFAFPCACLIRALDRPVERKSMVSVSNWQAKPSRLARKEMVGEFPHSQQSASALAFAPLWWMRCALGPRCRKCT